MFFNQYFQSNKKPTKDIKTAIQAAIELKEVGEPNAALAELIRIVKENPDCGYCRYEMGKLAFELQKAGIDNCTHSGSVAKK